MKKPHRKTGYETEMVLINRILRMLLEFDKATKLRVINFVLEAIRRENGGEPAVVMEKGSQLAAGVFDD